MFAKSWLLVVSVTATSAAFAQTQAIDRADSLAALFQYRPAIRAYHEADGTVSVRKLSGLAMAENMLGLDFLADNRKDSAEVHFERAIQASEQMADHFPDNAATYFHLAAAYGDLALLKGGKSKVRIGRDVERYGLRAIEIDSSYADALCVLGVFYREVAKLNWIERLVAKTLFGGLPSGSLEQSERYLRRAARSDPESPFAAYELGQTLLEMKRPDEARSQFEKLLRLQPRNGQNTRDMKDAAEWLKKHPGR